MLLRIKITKANVMLASLATPARRRARALRVCVQAQSPTCCAGRVQLVVIVCAVTCVCVRVCVFIEIKGRDDVRASCSRPRQAGVQDSRASSVAEDGARTVRRGRDAERRLSDAVDGDN